MTKMEVVSVRPIPGSNGHGFEVEVRETMKETSKEGWMGELIEIASRLPNVELKQLLWFARAFEKQVKEGAPAGTSEAL